MAAPDLARRRFVTALDVDQAARGGDVLVLGERDVLTDAAKQRARDLSVEVHRGHEAGSPAQVAAPAPVPAQPPAQVAAEPVVDPSLLRDVVLAALRDELGPDADGLDDALDRVLSRLSLNDLATHQPNLSRPTPDPSTRSTR